MSAPPSYETVSLVLDRFRRLGLADRSVLEAVLPNGVEAAVLTVAGTQNQAFWAALEAARWARETSGGPPLPSGADLVTKVYGLTESGVVRVACLVPRDAGSATG